MRAASSASPRCGRTCRRRSERRLRRVPAAAVRSRLASQVFAHSETVSPLSDCWRASSASRAAMAAGCSHVPAAIADHCAASQISASRFVGKVCGAEMRGARPGSVYVGSSKRARYRGFDAAPRLSMVPKDCLPIVSALRAWVQIGYTHSMPDGPCGIYGACGIVGKTAAGRQIKTFAQGCADQRATSSLIPPRLHNKNRMILR